MYCILYGGNLCAKSMLKVLKLWSFSKSLCDITFHKTDFLTSNTVF